MEDEDMSDDDDYSEDDASLLSYDDGSMTPRQRAAHHRLGLVRLMLKMNAAPLTYLCIGDDAFYTTLDIYAPRDGRYTIDGPLIGRNTVLTDLHFLRSHEVPEGQYKAFFRGVAKNRSIETLSFDRNNYHGGKVFEILTPFFAKNRNFRELCVKDTIDEPEAIHYLVSALAKAKGSSLEHLELTDIGGEFQDENKEKFPHTLRNSFINKFFSALAGFPSLTTLILPACGIEKKATVALATFLRRPNCIVKHLNLAHNCIDDDSVQFLVDALAEENSTVEELDLGRCCLIVRGWGEFPPLLQKLREFSCRWTPGGNIIADALANGSNSTLSKLDLARTPITDDTIINLIEAMIRKNIVLTHLNISDCSATASAGFGPLCSYLSRADCILEDLKIYDVTMTEGRVSLLANAISHNKSLTFLGLSPGRSYDSERMDDAKWDLLTNALGNPDSIDATYNSNHTLHKIDIGYMPDELPRELKMYLNMNSLSSRPSAAAHLKIFYHHFRGGDFGLEPFADMGAAVLPYALAWACKETTCPGRDPAALSYLYNVLKNKSSLLDFGRGQKNRDNRRPGNKRKRRS